MEFIGRKQELKILKELTQKNSASFVIVRGRRRIGKSRLIREFSKSFRNYYEFIGLAPTKQITAQHQLTEFSKQLSQQFHTPPAVYNDWNDVFWALAERVKKSKNLILFDEISWMGSCDPTFLAKIKNLWDSHLTKNPNLIFVICGSASSWIEKNILSATGFFGRISNIITLKELSLKSYSNLWPKNISAFEKLKVLSITGGIPKYLEEINPKQSAEENIKRLCFLNSGFLVEEFERIFSDTFLRNSQLYIKIIEILSTSTKKHAEIQILLGGKQICGRLSEYLSELELAGFIQRDYTWHIKTGQISRTSCFRLKDNYMRFYLKYIRPNRQKIQNDSYIFQSLNDLPNWNIILGLQFENLVINNASLLIKALNIYSSDIICANPFFQRQTSKQKGCQIDYMIQTKFRTLYVCEIKFSQNKINSKVIEEVQQKIDRLKAPKGFSIRPVLIHVNGIENSVKGFFTHIINMEDLIKSN